MMSLWIAALIGAAGAPSPAQSPPAGMIDIGGRRLHLHCLGAGSPTVILTSGLGDGGETWRTVQPQLARTTRVCAWSRAGLGLSEPSPEPQDASHTTADLKRLLKAARVAGPYVLVAHSIGSFETLMFAYRNRRSVAAVVLIDPSSPFQNRRFATVSPAFGAFNANRLKNLSTELRACAAGLRAGETAPKSCGDAAPTAPLPARIAMAEAIASMTENWDTSSAQLLKSRRRLGRIPLIVLTAGKRAPLQGDLDRERPKITAEWGRMHDELTALSTRGIRRTVPDAAHYIHVDRPDAVIAAIEDAVSSARSTRR